MDTRKYTVPMVPGDGQQGNKGPRDERVGPKGLKPPSSKRGKQG